MPELRAIAEKVRSKNAGPFWVTIDIFCGSPEAFSRVSTGLHTNQVAACFDTPVQVIKRFDIPSLNVVKISVPRPQVQGTIADRDMHGAAYAALVAALEIE
ncbi:MAG: DUF4387 family protein [Pseudomonadota bacterium]